MSWWAWIVVAWLALVAGWLAGHEVGYRRGLRHGYAAAEVTSNLMRARRQFEAARRAVEHHDQEEAL